MTEEEKKPGFSLSDIKVTLVKPSDKRFKDIAAFNTYLLYQENTQRLSGDLPKGTFRLSYSVIENELGFKRWKVQELMRYFLDNEIIKCIEKSTKKGVVSIYAYTTIYYYNNHTDIHTDNHTDNHTDIHTDKDSISNGLNGVNHTDIHTDNHTDIHTDNHTLLKYNIKNNKNNNMPDSKESDAPPGAFKSDNNNSNKTTKSSKPKKPKKVFEESSIEYQLSKKLYQYVLEVKPKTKENTDNFQKWCKDFDLIFRIDKRKVEEVETLIDWIFNSTSKDAEFWRGNIASPGALRGETKSGADKFADIYSKMEKDTNYYRPSQKDLEKELPPITAEEFYDI